MSTSKSYKIFISTPNIADEAKTLLSQNKCICEFGDDNSTSKNITERVRNFQPDGIILRRGKITQDVIEACKRLKVIAKHGVGIDNIDIACATEHRIPVLITAMANFESVAEHTFALIFSILRRVPLQDKKIRKGKWDKKNYEGDELLGKTLGLVGFGRIGKRLFEFIQPFQVKVIVYDPYVKIKQQSEKITQVSDLSELLLVSDIISLHCSLTPDTKGLIGDREINIMKKGAYIINTARGAIIDEQALIGALQNNKLAGAALDTLEDEPPDPCNPLFQMENVIVTPHIGGVSQSSFVNMGVDSVKNVLSVLNNNKIEMSCVVNKELFNG